MFQKKMTKLAQTFIFSVISVLFTSCQFMNLPVNKAEITRFIEEQIGKLDAPYIITIPQYICDEEKCPYGELVFSFHNKSGKTVSEIEVAFSMEENASFVRGNGHCSAQLVSSLSADEVKKLVIPLENYVYCASTKEPDLTKFYIYKIRYEDGSVWEDFLGKYNVGGQ